MNIPRGISWCLASILLVSFAQLALKWAMLTLPELSEWSFSALKEMPKGDWPGSAALLAGLGGYLASMFCWFMALHFLPLNYAYPMLGLSYAIVSLLAAMIPDLDESVNPLKIAGVLCILFGLGLIGSSAFKNQRS